MKQFLFLLIFFISALLRADTISNTATASFTINGVSKKINSNIVIDEIKETIGEISLYRENSSSSSSKTIKQSKYLDSNGNWISLSKPILDNESVLDISSPVNVSSSSVYTTSDLILIEVKDLDMNTDINKINTLTVDIVSPNLDKETLQLFETDLNTGIFTGYINVTEKSSINLDGILSILSGGDIEITYKDQSGDIISNAKITPNSYVFMAETGEPLSDIEVSLIDITNNSTIKFKKTDSLGKYNFGFVPKGNYKLKIVDSTKTYYFPSVYSPEDLSKYNYSVIDNLSYGKSFFHKGGSFKKIDVPLDRDRAIIWIEKEVNKNHVSIGDIIQYTLTVHNDGNAKVNDIIVKDYLPLGLKYKKGTSKLKDKKIKPTLSDDGRTLLYNIPLLEGNSETKIKLITEVTPGIVNGEATNIAWVDKNHFIEKSNVASAKIKVEEELMRSEGIIVGQVFNCKYPDTREFNGIKDIRIYLEDGSYILTDENGKYHFEGVHSGTHVVQVDEGMLPEEWEIGILNNNTRHAGRKFSQFVNMGKGSLKRVDFCLNRKKEIVISNNDKFSYKIPEIKNKTPKYKPEMLDEVQDKEGIVWPKEGYIPSVPSTKIAIAHKKGTTVILTLNKKEVDKLNFRGTKSDDELDTVLDIYAGVDLLYGPNQFVAKIIKNGKTLKIFKRIVNVTGKPVRVEYLKDKSFTIADGKHNPVIAVKFIDSNGNPLRDGVTGEFTVDSPYYPKKNMNEMKENPLGLSNRDKKWIINHDGIAYIQLEPTTDAGVVSLHFNILKRDIIIRPYLTPKLRDWIMVGFAEGTVGYNTLKGNQEGLSGNEKDTYLKDGRISFFAKGRIKGDALLTIAYDTGKDTKNSKLFDEIDPNKYYTLYNDGSNQAYEAASRKKLYVKVEKDNMSIMYGDFNTNFTTTRLSSYSRSMTGLKTEYHGDKIEGTAFISKTDQLFMKDEIRGDGTSGKYFLKNKNIIYNSEKITIEVRDRYRNEIIISSVNLERYKDYTIDYDEGSLYFKEPIYSSDKNFNPRYIVVDYELEGDGSEHYTYGGRGSVNLLNNNLNIGGTYINEDNGKQKTELYGVDAQAKITDSIIAKAEYAKTKTTEDSNTTYGEAKLLEFDYIKDNYYGRLYFREQDTSFGLGQLNSSLGGTRKFGAELKKTFDNRVFIHSLIYRDMNLENDTNQDVAEAKIGINREDWSIFTGYRYSKNTKTAKSDQLLIGGSYSLLDSRLKLYAEHDHSLGADEDKLYPTKTMLGAEYAISSNARIFGKYEWAKDGDIDERGKIGLSITPWEGMTLERTTVTEFSNDLSRVYDTIGLLQTYNITDNLSINLGYENSILGDDKILTDDDNSSIEPFSAYRLGFNYHNDNWTGLTNFEYRDSEKEKKYNFMASLYSQLNDELAVAFSSGYFLIDNINDGKNKEANARFSLAYRPSDTDWIVLNKLDYILNHNDLNSENTSKLINNMNINYSPNNYTEISFQHGFKYVEESIEDYDHEGITQLIGLDSRYDFNEKLSAGLQASVLYSFSADNMDYCYGAYIDYLIFTNMLIELGYNIEGFEDDDFSLQNYRASGSYIKFKMKFDQQTLKDMVRLQSW